MKKNALICSFTGMILSFGAILCPFHVNAAPPAAMDECSKELLLSYYPETFVNDTLKRFNISEDKWAGINASLSKKDKDIVKLVEQKASTMTPNPLKDPQQRQAAVKLFRETLLQVFTDALKENGINDTSQFQAMLDDIQQQKAKKFAQCMEKQKEQMKQNNVAPTGKSEDSNDSDDNSDEDDDDYDDNDDDDNAEDENKDKSNGNSKSNSSSNKK